MNMIEESLGNRTEAACIAARVMASSGSAAAGASTAMSRISLPARAATAASKLRLSAARAVDSPPAMEPSGVLARAGGNPGALSDAQLTSSSMGDERAVSCGVVVSVLGSAMLIGPGFEEVSGCWRKATSSAKPASAAACVAALDAEASDPSAAWGPRRVSSSLKHASLPPGDMTVGDRTEPPGDISGPSESEPGGGEAGAQGALLPHSAPFDVA